MTSCSTTPLGQYLIQKLVEPAFSHRLLLVMLSPNACLLTVPYELDAVLSSCPGFAGIDERRELKTEIILKYISNHP